MLMHSLAFDLFSKLCAPHSTDRYTAERALKHPWITRQLKSAVPLTLQEEITKLEREFLLKKMVKVVFSLSAIMKKPTDLQATYLKKMKEEAEPMPEIEHFLQSYGLRDLRTREFAAMPPQTAYSSLRYKRDTLRSSGGALRRELQEAGLRRENEKQREWAQRIKRT